MCASKSDSKLFLNVSNIDTITIQQFRNLVIQHVREGKEGNIEPQDLFLTIHQTSENMHLIGCMNSVIAMNYESGSNQRLREALQRNDTINVSVNYPNVRGNLHEFRNVTRDK